MYLSCFILFSLISLSAETFERILILMMTNVIVQIANRIQKPPSDAGFFFEVDKKCRMVILNRIRW